MPAPVDSDFSGVLGVEPNVNENGELVLVAVLSAGLAALPKLKGDGAGALLLVLAEEDVVEVEVGMAPKLNGLAAGEDPEALPKVKGLGLLGDEDEAASLAAPALLPLLVGGLSMLEEKRRGLGLLGAANEKAGAFKPGSEVLLLLPLSCSFSFCPASPVAFLSASVDCAEESLGLGKENGDFDEDAVAFEGSKTKLPAGGVDAAGAAEEAVTGLPAKVKPPVGTEGGAVAEDVLLLLLLVGLEAASADGAGDEGEADLFSDSFGALAEVEAGAAAPKLKPANGELAAGLGASAAGVFSAVGAAAGTLLLLALLLLEAEEEGVGAPKVKPEKGEGLGAVEFVAGAAGVEADAGAEEEEAEVDEDVAGTRLFLLSAYWVANL